MSAYSSLAGVYDALLDDVDYAAWAARYLDIFSAKGVLAESALDVACGTGSMTLALADAGLNVIGMDISEEMLMEAREKREDLVLARMDMRRFSLPQLVDVMVCANDGVNYLHSEEDALAFFRCAHTYLAPGGALAFDISTPEKLVALDGEVFFDDRDDMTLLWSNSLEGDILRMELMVFIPEEDGRYIRFDEEHRQRLWTAEDLARLLRAAGFGDIEVYGGEEPRPPQSGDERWFLFGRKITQQD